MKKVGVVTLQGNYNFGNRLQNYALLKVLNDMGYDAYNIVDNRLISFIKKAIKTANLGKKSKKDIDREKNFIEFSKYMKEIKGLYYTRKCKLPYCIENKFYKFVVGSDQVWNFNNKVVSKYMLDFTSSEKKISYAASLGKSYINKKLYPLLEEKFNSFPFLSVREDVGKELIEDITKRNDIEIVIDPTLLLSTEEWDNISKRPRQYNGEKYILNYFLGNLSSDRLKIIESVANENGCVLINILDKKSDYYECGPSEFLFLVKNAFLICTDSFHSAVFSFLFNKPFIIFDREQMNLENMNSRMYTLTEKFELENRFFNGKITNDNINHDYSKSYELLDAERKKSFSFLHRALYENDGEINE